MGEMADGILEGVFCEGCGVWMGDDEAPGYPRRCSGCGGDGAGRDRNPGRAGSFVCTICLSLPAGERRKKINFKSEGGLAQHVNSGVHSYDCPDCGKVMVTGRALRAHRAAKHRGIGTP